RVIADLDRFAHVALQVLLLVHNFHGAATQHIAWAHHQGVANFSSQSNGFAFGTSRTVWRLTQTQLGQQLLETLTVFSHVNGFRAGTDDRYTVGFQSTCQFQRSLATVLNDGAHGFFDVNDFQHVFQSQRLEVQTIGGVVVGRNGFGVAVDHDGFVTIFAQCQSSVHAAV